MSKSSVQPRKRPRTARAQEIYSAILDATQLELTERGFAGLTTNRIAKIAGVSVGSIYQYFGNKEAIVAEVIRRNEQRDFDAVIERVADADPADTRTLARIAIQTLIEGQGSLRTRRALLGVPRVWSEDKSDEIDEKMETRTRAILANGDPAQVRKGARDIMSFIVIFAVEQLIEEAVWHRPELLRDPRFAHELEELVMRYLAPD